MTGFSADTVALPAGDDRWVLYNVRTRTALGLDGESLVAAGRADTANVSDAGPFSVWDVSWFSQANGSVEDPTRLRRDPSTWGEPRQLIGRRFYDELMARWLIVADTASYRMLFDRPRHPLEPGRVGNFHDQLGRHLLVDRRIDPETWWVEQKFRSDGTIRGDNAYGTVQWPALERYLDTRVRPGMQVIDVGCGTGFYSAEMARRGADVHGVDPSRVYLERARARQAERCRFSAVPLDQGQGLVGLQDASADLVFMSDALLFWFVPLSRRGVADPSIILNDIRRVLRPGGIFVSVEPHGDFYLAPWIGAADAPWTVVTEHRTRRFSTTPAFAVAAEAVLRAGFTLTHIEELYRAEDRQSTDARADGFTDEFPLWTLAEFRRNDGA